MSDPGRQLSDDGLWEWDGSRWVQLAELGFQCPACGILSAVQSGSRNVRCSAGHEFDFVQCLSCKGVQLRAREYRDFGIGCASCGASTKIPKTVAAWEWAQQESLRGTWPPGRSDTGRRTVRDLTLAQARGTSLGTGQAYSVDFGDSGIRILWSSAQVEELPYHTVHAVEVSAGPTRADNADRRRNIAGAAVGFGLIGAAVAASSKQAMLVSAVLRIATVSSEFVFVSEQYGPEELRQLLAPVQARLGAAQRPPPANLQAPASPGPPVSVADELAKLAKLRDDGVLTPAEFDAAKARLLTGL